MSEKLDLWKWLGFEFRPLASPELGKFLGWLLTTLALLLAMMALGLIVQLLLAVFSTPPESFRSAEGIRNLGLAAAALIGVPFLVWRSIVAQRQVEVAGEGQITDRINKAVEGLGAIKYIKKQRTDKNGNLTFEKDDSGANDYSKPVMIEISEPNIEVRIGAIFALERIAQDSDRDHIQIMEILCAYVSNNLQNVCFRTSGDVLPATSWRSLNWDKLKDLPPDISLALQVIQRRSAHQKSIEKQVDYTPHLIDANFSGLRLSNVSLGGLNLVGSKFRGAVLSVVDFSLANLSVSKFEGAKILGCNFDGTLLDFSTFEAAEFEFSELSDAWCGTAIDLDDASFFNCSVSASVLSSRAFVQTFVNLELEQTKALTEFPSHWPIGISSNLEFESEYNKWIDDPKGYAPPVLSEKNSSTP